MEWKSAHPEVDHDYEYRYRDHDDHWEEHFTRDKGKKKAAAKKPAKKAKFDSDGSESDFNMEDVAPARDRPGKRRFSVSGIVMS